MPELLPSWRPGPTKDAVLGALGRSSEVPVPARLACLDNDGTLWAEKPTYVQWNFFVDELQRRATDDPTLADRPELAAVLHQDMAALGELGLPRIALALVELFQGWAPDPFAERVQEFFAEARHPTLGLAYADAVYQPMLELLDALRAHDFTVAIVSGGGVDFLRAVSEQLYDVPPHLVVGTSVTYDVELDDRGSPTLRRTATLNGAANEGTAKISNIWAGLGGRPIFAAGNSLGDAEMLEWAQDSGPAGFALLVDHDDAEREFSYASVSGTLSETVSVTDRAAASGWTVASIARDWAEVFRTGGAAAERDPGPPG